MPAAANGAAQAIWVYYLTLSMTVSNARIRYAKKHSMMPTQA
jgi:uncharacterized protein involved in high-affinity Fe2+ transport